MLPKKKFWLICRSQIHSNLSNIWMGPNLTTSSCIYQMYYRFTIWKVSISSFPFFSLSLFHSSCLIHFCSIHLTGLCFYLWLLSGREASYYNKPVNSSIHTSCMWKNTQCVCVQKRGCQFFYSFIFKWMELFPVWCLSES